MLDFLLILLILLYKLDKIFFYFTNYTFIISYTLQIQLIYFLLQLLLFHYQNLLVIIHKVLLFYKKYNYEKNFQQYQNQSHSLHKVKLKTLL